MSSTKPDQRRPHKVAKRAVPKETGLGAEFRPLPEEEEPVAENDIGAEPVFPPTDPVIRVRRDRRPEILGGFSETSMDSVDAEPSAEDRAPSDEALAHAVRRELREDAATTDLRISVQVEDGVVRLRGTVPEMIDAENAEEVAGRIPGVGEVVEELVVAAQEQ